MLHESSIIVEYLSDQYDLGPVPKDPYERAKGHWPRQTIPKAVRRVSKRIIIYYVGAIFVLGVNVSSNDPVLASYVTNPQGSYQGPFVLMVQRANIAELEHVFELNLYCGYLVSGQRQPVRNSGDPRRQKSWLQEPYTLCPCQRRARSRDFWKDEYIWRAMSGSRGFRNTSGSGLHVC